MTAISSIEHSLPFDPAYGCDLSSLLKVGAPEEPGDLCSFWKRTYCEAMEIELQIECRRIDSPREEIELFEVDYNSWDGIRVGAWLTVPHNVPVERGMVVGHGYGGRDAPEFEVPGPACATIFPCARGFGRSKRVGLPDASDRHVLFGIESPETYIHRGCVVDFWCAATALIELYPEAAGDLHYRGASFGGGIGAMALAWDGRFRSAFLSVPSFGNHPLRVSLKCTGSGEAVRQYHRRHPEVLEALQYFDAATIARHIRIPVLCECALFDPAVPPPGQFAVFNALGGPKELFVRGAGHFNYPEEAADDRRSWEAQERWFTP